MSQSKRGSISLGSGDADNNTVHSSSIRQQSDGEHEASTSSHGSQNTASQSSDKQTTNCEKGYNLLATCRLRHGLNEDCLCEIFYYLSLCDLIQLCELDIYYQDLISKWIIGKKVIDFTEPNPYWTAVEMFEVFGKTMRKIKIGNQSLEWFFNLVIRYCALGVLTEIELNDCHFGMPTPNMEEAMPFFSNLRKLVLHQNDNIKCDQFFLSRISIVAVNLTHLTLDGVNVRDEWFLEGDRWTDLKELQLRHASIQINNLSEFLRTKSKLEVFSYIGDSNIHLVIGTLIKYCPQLKTFIDCHSHNPYGNTISDQMKHRYDVVCQLNSLKVIGLTSYTQCGSDLYYPLIQIASKIEMATRIERLAFFIKRDKTIILPEPIRCAHKAFDSFSGVKVVELDLLDSYDLNAEFICEFISKIPNIEKFSLIGNGQKLRNVNKIIDLAPNINELDISLNYMVFQLPVEMKKIVRSIQKRRELQITEGQQNPKPFHIVVNMMQWRELQIYKDIGTILTTRVVNCIWSIEPKLRFTSD